MFVGCLWGVRCHLAARLAILAVFSVIGLWIESNKVNIIKLYGRVIEGNATDLKAIMRYKSRYGVSLVRTPWCTCPDERVFRMNESGYINVSNVRISGRRGVRVIGIRVNEVPLYSEVQSLCEVSTLSPQYCATPGDA